MPKKAAISFFSDQNVAESAVRALDSAGHKISRLRDCMAPDSKDPLVALACANAGQVLVTHDKDFRALSKRLNISQKQYQLRLHRIQLMCDEPSAAGRLQDAMKLIESEWRISREAGRAMVLELYKNFIRIYR